MSPTRKRRIAQLLILICLLCSGFLFSFSIYYLFLSQAPAHLQFLCPASRWLAFHLPIAIILLITYIKMKALLLHLVWTIVTYCTAGTLIILATHPLVVYLDENLPIQLMFFLRVLWYLLLLPPLLLALTYRLCPPLRRLLILSPFTITASVAHPQKYFKKNLKNKFIDAKQRKIQNYHDHKSPIQLGVWQLSLPSDPQRTFVCLYAHGAGGTRANRLRTYDVILAELQFHLVSFDYRGYGDSSKVKQGVSGFVSDMRAVYEWLLNTGIRPHQIVPFGHSLGSSVVVNMLSQLPQDQVPLAAILEAPFTTLADVLPKTYLVKCLAKWPFFDWLFVDPVRADPDLNFDSISPLPKVRCPLLIVHSEADQMVPFSMGKQLYEAACHLQPQAVRQKTKFYTVSSLKKLGHFISGFDVQFPIVVCQFLLDVLEQSAREEPVL